MQTRASIGGLFCSFALAGQLWAPSAALKARGILGLCSGVLSEGTLCYTLLQCMAAAMAWLPSSPGGLPQAQQCYLAHSAPQCTALDQGSSCGPSPCQQALFHVMCKNEPMHQTKHSQHASHGAASLDAGGAQWVRKSPGRVTGVVDPLCPHPARSQLDASPPFPPLPSPSSPLAAASRQRRWAADAAPLLWRARPSGEVRLPAGAAACGVHRFWCVGACVGFWGACGGRIVFYSSRSLHWYHPCLKTPQGCRVMASAAWGVGWGKMPPPLPSSFSPSPFPSPLSLPLPPLLRYCR